MIQAALRGGIRSFLLYSGPDPRLYLDNDISVCATIQICVDASNHPLFMLTKVYFRGFITIILMQGFYYFFVELTSRHEGKAPRKYMFFFLPMF